MADKEQIGWQPLYKPEPGRGYIGTNAFIQCANCGKGIHPQHGPRRGVICLDCVPKLEEWPTGEAGAD